VRGFLATGVGASLGGGAHMTNIIHTWRRERKGTWPFGYLSALC
jgi:hypothetical protein